jgi:hypothetical protein
MANTISIKRRINGAGGSPTAAGSVEGEIAFNAPGAAGSTTKPDMYFFDGAGWRLVNPSTTITTQTISLGSLGNIGSAFTTWDAVVGQDITGDVVIADFGSPSISYILTNPAAPGTIASWTPIGMSTNFSTQALAHAGTDAASAISPATLRGETSATSAGAADADKLPRLNASGKIDSSFLSITSNVIKGSVDVTIPKPGATTYVNGDTIFASVTGTVDATYPLDAGTTVKAGDMLVYDGTKWHIIPSSVDMSAYVPLAGTNSMAGKVLWSTAGTTVMLDLNGHAIANSLIDAGTF